jgi:hypothetical protein
VRTHLALVPVECVRLDAAAIDGDKAIGDGGGFSVSLDRLMSTVVAGMLDAVATVFETDR